MRVIGETAIILSIYLGVGWIRNVAGEGKNRPTTQVHKGGGGDYTSWGIRSWVDAKRLKAL